MPIAAIPIPNFTGGLNTGLHPTHIKPNELAELVNYYVQGDSIRPRLPSTVKTSSPVMSGLSMYSYKPTGDTFKLLIASNELSLLTPSAGLNAPTALTLRYGTTYSGSSSKPFWAQVNGIAYFSDPQGAPLRRVTDSYYEDAGIVAPLAAATLADAGATGTMPAGAYAVVYRYKNSATGDISDYSPVSNFVTIAANHELSMTGIVASVLPQVDTIEIGITPAGQTNAFLSYTEIANGVTSATIDFSTSAELGGYFVNTAGLPPTTVYGHCIWDDRQFVHDGDFLFYSAYLQYETFDTTNNRLPALSNDGHKIKVLFPWGSRLIVGKANYIVYFTATGTGGYQPTVLSDKYGVRSPHAMRSVENILIWFDGSRFLRSDSGATPRDVSGIRIQQFLERIPAANTDDLSAEIFPGRDIYVVTVPQSSGDPVVLAYNYKDEAWSQFSYENPPVYIAEGYDSNDNRLIYGLMEDGHVWELFDPDATDDAGDEIEFSWKTRAFHPDNPIETITLDRLSLLTSNTANTGTLEVFEDGKAVATLSCAAYLYSPRSEWKTFPLNTRNNSSGARHIQVRHSTTNLPHTARFYAALLEVQLSSPTERDTYPVDV